jgi:hypothetical protein
MGETATGQQIESMLLLLTRGFQKSQNVICTSAFTAHIASHLGDVLSTASILCFHSHDTPLLGGTWLTRNKCDMSSCLAFL